MFSINSTITAFGKVEDRAVGYGFFMTLQYAKTQPCGAQQFNVFGLVPFDSSHDGTSPGLGYAIGDSYTLTGTNNTQGSPAQPLVGAQAAS